MDDDIASQFPEMDLNEVKYANFIKQRILKNGGSLKFLHITGQLSQLEHDVRVAIGSGSKELMSFLRKHEKLFAVNDGLVTLKNAPNNQKDLLNEASTNGRKEIKNILPKKIHNVDGVVIKVHPTYGFITIREPVKATVYFTPSCFGDKTKTLLSDLGILPGKKLKLNAVIGNLEFDSKYRATRVWIPEFVQNEVLHPKGFKPKVPKSRETGCYDANTSEGWGKIQKIFDSYGFIMADGSSQNTIFFYKSKVCNVENVKDLTQIFNPGDLVEYKAIRSQKNETARWEATKVWIRKNLNPKKQNLHKEDSKSDKKTVMMLNQKGKIYPHSKGIVIKFGENESQLADADSCVFFLHEVKVEDVGWEFSDGDAINFEGMKIKSAPGYKALLAWVGKRPNFVLPTDLGDFSRLSDEDANNISEDESCISKASEISGTNSDLSGKQKNNIYSSTSSLVSNSSRNSNYSRSRINNMPRHLNKKSYSSSNSISSQKSEFNKKRRNRSQSKKYEHDRNSKSSSENSFCNQQKKSQNNKSKASSRESLNSMSSDLNYHLKPNPNLYTNWGDSPYPDLDDDKQSNYEDIDSKEDYYQDTSIRSNKSSADLKSEKSIAYFEEPNIETHELSDNKSNDEDDFTDVLESDKKYSISNKNAEDSTLGIISRSDRFAELLLSEEEFSDALENGNETIAKKDDNREREDENVSSASSDNECEEVQPEKELEAYIKRFLGLDGRIKKVFCKYAEIENEMLKKPGTFFWKDLYHNGVPVSDKFDDLNEVLTPGQLIKFNCIEIVDDLGCCFLKVTVAWKGAKKPQITEMTSQEFISQNDLHVTAEEELVSTRFQGPAVESMRHLNEKGDTTPQQKFLMVSSYIDDDGEEDVDVSNNDESSKYVPSEPEHSEIVVNEDMASIGGEYTELRDRIFSEFETTMDVPQLTNIVSRLLESYKNSQMDSNVVASDMINMFLSTIGAEKRHELLPGATYEILHDGKEELQTVVNDASHPVIQKVEMTSSYSQTIITGKIFSESVLLGNLT